MRFTPEMILAGLQKRKESAPPTAAVGPKRSRREGEGSTAGPVGATPEVVVMEGGGEENLPTGVPIRRPPRGSLETTRDSPAEDTGRSQEGREAIDVENSSSTEAEEGAERDPQPRQETGVDATSGAAGGSAPPPRLSGPVPMYRSCLSETVLKLAVLPKLQAALKAMPMEEALDNMFSAALQLTNSLFVLRDGLVSAKPGMARAKSLIEGLEKQLSEASSREAAAKARELEAKARESEVLNDLRRVQEDNRAWRERAEKDYQILDTKFCEAMARLQPAEEKLKEAVHKLEHAEGRAEHAEGRADNAEAAARDAAERLVLAEKEVREALDRAAAAEAKAQRAVQDYKGSSDFSAECSEAVLDAYVQGFEKCKERLARRFQLGGLEDFRPGEEDASAAAEGAAGDPGAAGGQPVDPTAAGEKQGV